MKRSVAFRGDFEIDEDTVEDLDNLQRIIAAAIEEVVSRHADFGYLDVETIEEDTEGELDPPVAHGPTGPDGE